MKFDGKTKVRLLAGSTAVLGLIGGAFLIASMMKRVETAQTKEYFLAHIDEAKQTAQKCKNLADHNEIQPEVCAAAKTVAFFHSGKKPIKGDEKEIKTW